MRTAPLVLFLSTAGTSLALPCGLESWTTTLTKTVSWFKGESLPEQSFFPDVVSEEEGTIYQTLRGRDEFSTLVKIIDKYEEAKKVLDSDKMLTFFAPDNDALSTNMPHHIKALGDHDEEKKKFILNTLAYHTIPGVLESRLFGQNSTIATAAHARDGSFDGSRRRVKVEASVMPPWNVKLNGYVNIKEKDIHAKNGVIHKTDSILWSNPDIMDILYLIPNQFSISTTAMLKVDLQHNYEFNSQKAFRKEHQHNDRRGKGSPITTVFVPNNDAWNKLPEDLVFYLFSPMGERTLRKLMAWHTIPNSAIFAEWVRNVHDDDDSHSMNVRVEPDLSFEWDRHFPTLIDQKMPVHVKKVKSKIPGSSMWNTEVQGHGLYSISWDNPAQNGAFHIIDQVLCPKNKEGIDEAQNEKDWSEWKEWLNDWTNSVNEV